MAVRTFLIRPVGLRRCSGVHEGIMRKTNATLAAVASAAGAGAHHRTWRSERGWGGCGAGGCAACARATVTGTATARLACGVLPPQRLGVGPWLLRQRRACHGLLHSVGGLNNPSLPAPSADLLGSPLSRGARYRKTRYFIGTIRRQKIGIGRRGVSPPAPGADMPGTPDPPPTTTSW